jgi:hypothetical protein
MFTYSSMALQPFVGPWPPFQFLDPIYSRQGHLDGGLARREALARGEWSVSRPSRITPGERALSTHWIGGWVDPRAGLDDVEK